ncbi:MAG: Fur family transcriptional regulator [Anaerolineales bacterium]
MSDEILSSMRAAGKRVTAPRRAVAQAISEADGWLRPQQVHQRGQRIYRPLGLVTVYRTLSLLLDLGCVRRIHLEDGCHGYARAQLDHGHHLVCRRCQQVTEFAGSEDMRPIMRRVAQHTGFLVEDHMLELVGLCPTCQEETAANDGR